MTDEQRADEASHMIRWSEAVSLNAVVHLLIKKGTFTAEEYKETLDWFRGKFEELERIGTEYAAKGGSPAGLPKLLQPVYAEMRKKLFNG